jgi:nitrogen fixation NifU-like protein
MSEINELYQETILEHNRKPRNFRSIENADRTAIGNNPLCGDALRVYLKLDGDRIAEAAFEGSGCAISKASASMMTQAVQNKTVEEAQMLFEEFHKMVTGKLDPETDDNHLGSLRIFAGVLEFPARVKCASLSWHTLNAAISGKSETSTE